jgi:hypothetical protein
LNPSAVSAPCSARLAAAGGAERDKRASETDGMGMSQASAKGRCHGWKPCQMMLWWWRFTGSEVQNLKELRQRLVQAAGTGSLQSKTLGLLLEFERRTTAWRRHKLRGAEREQTLSAIAASDTTQRQHKI